MWSPYRFEVALFLSGLIAATIGLAITVIALFTRNHSTHVLARNLLGFSLLCLILQSIQTC